MKQPLSTLKNWFSNLRQPTGSNFSDMLDSFFHRDARIPALQIDGLSQMEYRGLATAATNPGTPETVVKYDATPGVTYPHFKDDGGVAITIPTEVGGKQVVRASLIGSGAVWNYEVGEMDLDGYTTVGDLEQKFDLLFNERSNRFDIQDPDVVLGSFINSSGALTGSSETYNTTGFIPVGGLEKVSVSFARFYACYDGSKTFIPGSYVSNSPQGQVTITIPPGSAYLRVSTPFTAVGGVVYWPTLMVNEGDVQLPFTPYIVDKIKDEYLPLVSESKLSFSEFQSGGANLANIYDDDRAIGRYLTSAGTLNTNPAYNTSGFIPVDSNVDPEVTVSSRRFSAFYNADKVFVPGSYVGTTGVDVTMTIPSGAAFMRLTTTVAAWEALMVNYGDSILPFEPYSPSYWMLKGVKAQYSSPAVDELLLFLPSEICIAVGRTIEIYHSQVAWCGNIDNYHFFWQGAGRGMKRKWSMSGDAGSIGEYPLTLTVYNNNMVQVARATTTVKVVGDMILAPFSILPVGDSLTNNKAWQPELISLSSGKISYEGTRGVIQVSPARTHEGRSGATAAWYLGDNTYSFDASGQQGIDGRTQDKNPFWNPNTNAFDFGYYKSNYAKDPDKALIFLGTNGMSLDPTVNANNIKAIVDGLRAEDPSLPIFVVLTLYRGGQNGLGNQTGSDGYVANAAWKLHEDREVFNLQVRVYELLAGYSNLWFIPLSLCHDSEYNYSNGMIPVNPRALQEEFNEVEATHPQLPGYLQMADIMFSVLAAHQ